jgi:hypothetical protein
MFDAGAVSIESFEGSCLRLARARDLAMGIQLVFF